MGRRLFLEVLAVTLFGAAGALAICYWAGPVVTAAVLPNGPVTLRLDVSPDWRVLLFTAVTALASAVAIGVFPCLRATRRDVQETLARNRHTASRSSRITTLLLSGQVALSVVLVTHAGLLARSLQELLRVDPGYVANGLSQVTVRPRPEASTRPDPAAYYPTLTEAVAGVPGVRRASLALFPLASGEYSQPAAAVAAPASDATPAGFNAVSPGFFATVGMQVIRGRDFTWADRSGALRVAIVSRSLAERLYPGQDALGQFVRLGTQPSGQSLEVVGIASDAHLYDLKGRSAFAAYIPALQYDQLAAGVVVLLRGDGLLDQYLEQAVQATGAGYVAHVAPLSESLGVATLYERVTAGVAVFFGALALVLAGLGMGTLGAYAVTLRTKEIGLRVALGASPASIVKDVLRRGLAAGGAGVVVGAPLALVSVGVVETSLFGVSPRDPMVLFGVPTLLLIVVALACIVPARRAASIDPAVSLRSE